MFSTPIPNLPTVPVSRASRDDGHGLTLTQTDPPAEKQGGDVVAAATAAARPTKVEHALPFEKEVPLFRKLQAESCEVDLLQVLLDLCKVGVDGGIGNEAARQSVLEIEPGVPREAVEKGAAAAWSVVNAETRYLSAPVLSFEPAFTDQRAYLR